MQQQYIRLINQNIIIKTLVNFIIYYPTPINLNFLWNFGSLAGFCLIIQLITGIFLAMHYVSNAEIAFNSVEHIMRDVNSGWFLRYLHANGASFFFLVVYTHIFRGLYYMSFLTPRHYLWCSGVIILLLMILTAFMGYVLPWGQMSFWAATVITKLASAIPIIGDQIVLWLWGGFAVDNATLNRFFSFHYLFPFLIAGLAILHLVFLHEFGSNNPIGVTSFTDKTSFDPYYILKDLLGFCIFIEIFSFFVFFFPNYLGHTDNYIPANPLVTPTHIVPEWYFLPFYAILRSIPDKLLGVLSLLNSIIVLFCIPFLFNIEKTTRFFIHNSFYRILFWFFFFNALILGWIGGKAIETPFYEIGQFATIIYFCFFYVLMFIEIFCILNFLDLIDMFKIVLNHIILRFIEYFVKIFSIILKIIFILLTKINEKKLFKFKR